jgi:phosphatidylcholine synthase
LAVHLYTASGAVWAALTALAIFRGDYRMAFLWMLTALVVDSTDGSLARRFRVKERWPGIDGRKLDDIVDYLNYTFLPLILIVHAEWVLEPRLLWIGLAAVASLFGFANVGAKEEDAGFFLGFPSYWNVFALYLFLLSPDPMTATAWALFLTVLTIVPLRFLYPSHSSRWNRFFTWGGLIWTVLVAWILLELPESHPEVAWISVTYPAAYCLLSFVEDIRARRAG